MYITFTDSKGILVKETIDFKVLKICSGNFQDRNWIDLYPSNNGMIGEARTYWSYSNEPIELTIE